MGSVRLVDKLVLTETNRWSRDHSAVLVVLFSACSAVLAVLFREHTTSSSLRVCVCAVDRFVVQGPGRDDLFLLFQAPPCNFVPKHNRQQTIPWVFCRHGRNCENLAAEPCLRPHGRRWVTCLPPRGRRYSSHVPKTMC